MGQLMLFAEKLAFSNHDFKQNVCFCTHQESNSLLLVTGLLKVWDAERQNEKNKETKSDDAIHTAARMTSGLQWTQVLSPPFIINGFRLSL